MKIVLAAAVALFASLPAGAARALDKVDPYICPTMLHGSGLDCFLEAVPQTYTMCRQIKSIEIIEFGLVGAQEGTNGAKTEGCIDKHKLTMALPFKAAQRESARNKDQVQSLRKLYDTWLEALGKIKPSNDETDDGYKLRVVRPYGEFNEQINAIRVLGETKPPVAQPAAKKKPKS